MSHLNWLIAGAIFLILELVLPGGVLGALAVSTLLIGLFIWLGWLTSFLVAVILWTLLVIMILMALRPIMRKLYPSQTSVGSVDEDEELRGLVVPVTEAIPAGAQGRVLIRGTTWIAAFTEPTLTAPQGSSVRLMARNNIVWYVEPIRPQEGIPS